MDFIAQLTGGGLIEWWGLLLIVLGVFFAGFVDAIAGGGGLISLPAYLLAGVPVPNAIYTHKLGATMGTLVATLKYLKEGFVQWKVVLPSVAFALLGSVIGARLTIIASDTVLMIFMLAVIPVAAFYVLKKDSVTGDGEPLEFKKLVIVCIFISLAIGLYDGFYGPGTGTFLMLLFIGVARMSAQHAAGATKIINLTTNASALFVYLINGGVWIVLGLIAGVFSIAGNYLGAKFFTENGAKVLKPVILLVLFIFALHLVFELIGISV